MKQKLCRYCEHMKDTGNGEGSSACEYNLAELGPELCGAYELARIYGGDDPSPDEPLPEATALINIRPQGDQAVIALYDQAVRLAEYARALTIGTDKDAKGAANDLAIIVGVTKAIEVERKKWTGPIISHLEAVRTAFGALTEPLAQANRMTREKILAYRAEQDRKRREAEAINQLRMEAAAAEMKLKGELTEPVDLVEAAAPVPDHVRAEMGTLGKMMVPKWAVQDFSQVPDEYKVIDAARVGKLVRAGLEYIPGVRIWKEETLRVTATR